MAHLPPWAVVLIAFFVAVAVVVLWIRFGPAPSHEREWTTEHAVPPEFVFEGERVTVRGVRNFTWKDAATFEPAWEERTYDLRELERVWFVLTPFSRTWRGPAHALLSFQFSDSTFLAISVEARREVGETYGIVKGMLRRFELIYVAGDEQDLVGLRAVHRPDQVYVYPVRVGAAGVRRLFLEMAASANRLRAAPEFYHSFTNNCTTRIVKHVNGVAPRSIPRSWKVVLPGYSDALAHALGLLDTPLSLDAARARWLVNDRARRWSGAPDFSLRIRGEEASSRDASILSPPEEAPMPHDPPFGRRDFLASLGSALAAGTLAPKALSASTPQHEALSPSTPHRPPQASSPLPPASPSPPSVRALREIPHDAWLEVDGEAIRANAAEVARLAEGRPILGVVKNNGYGLGTTLVARALDPMPEVATLAVVKVDEAFELLEAGIRTPILLMGLAPPDAEEELARRGVRLAPYTDDAPLRIARLAGAIGRPIPVHLYLDTGMGRMGMPDHRARPWLEALASDRSVAIEATMTELAETDHDEDQLRRFHTFAEGAREDGLPLGRLHAAASHALFFRPASLLSAVRPGLTLFGAYPAGARVLDTAELRPAHRLRARIIRLERLRPGDAVSYGMNYVADRPVWVAVVAAGHADGYPRRAVEGCRVLVGSRTYPVIGAVSASHTILEIGDEPAVSLGDIATLVGSDHPDIHPNEVSERAGISVYDVLMHLGGHLPKIEPA